MADISKRTKKTRKQAEKRAKDTRKRAEKRAKATRKSAVKTGRRTKKAAAKTSARTRAQFAAGVAVAIAAATAAKKLLGGKGDDASEQEQRYSREPDNLPNTADRPAGTTPAPTAAS